VGTLVTSLPLPETKSTLNLLTMKLTRLIFQYWVAWVTTSHSTPNLFDEDDGLIWYDGWWSTFWYMLNTSWYEMNDKMTSTTGDTRKYHKTMDFFNL